MVSADFPPQRIGGEAVMAEQTARALLERGIELTVIAPRQRGSAGFDRAWPGPIRRVPMIGNNFLTRIPSFYASASRALRETSAELVYSLRPVAVPRGIPQVHHFHTTRYGEARGCELSGARSAALLNRLYVPWDRAMARRATRCIVLGEPMQRDLQAFAGAAPRCCILGNALPPGRFSPGSEPRTWRRRLLYCGRLDARKGLSTLLQALAGLTQLPGTSLTMAGAGPQRVRLQALAKRLGVAPQVHFLGAVHSDELPGLYREHDLAVLPSLYEGFGLVIAEAMACGTPVLSSDACADLGQPRFAAGDATALQTLLRELLAAPEQLSDLSRRGLESAATLTLSHYTDRLLSIFQSALNEAGQHP